MDTYRSVCPYDCPDCCGLIVDIEEEQVVRVSGDKEHSFTRGTLCPKMVHYEHTIHSQERIVTPLKRVGRRGLGQFKAITWDEAIETISDRWKKIIEEHGAEAIMPYSYAGTMGVVQSSAGRPLFHAMGATLQEHTICSAAKSYGREMVLGNTFGMRPQEMQHSDLIILWSSNSLSTNIHSYHDLQIAKRKGATVWVIDTHTTPTSKWADETILVTPGSDGALALGIMNVLLAEDLINHSFIAQYVDGFDEFAETVLPKWTPEEAANITGVPPETIRKMAHQYASSRAPFIRLGSGLSRYGNGAMAVRLITILPCLVGAWANVGGGVLGSTSGGSFLPRSKVLRADLKTEGTQVVNMNQIGRALLGEGVKTPIKSLFIASSNPAITAPDQNKVIKGLKRTDLFTVVHERFMTETARYADIILPATTSVEHDDIYYSYGHYNLQVGYQLINPIGESKSNWDVMCLLAKAMGQEDEVFSKTARQMIEELINEAPDLSWEGRMTLFSGKPYEIPLPSRYKLDIKTASGKFEIIASSDAMPMPDYFPPHGGEGEFWLSNPPDPRILDSSFNERYDGSKEEESSFMKVFMHPQDAEDKGLKEGDLVSLSNERGTLKTRLYLDPTTQRGVVVSPGVWWLRNSSDERASINVLTSAETADRAHGSLFYDVKVNVKKSRARKGKS